MQPPTSFAELAHRIHQRRDQLTPAYQVLAERVLQDPEGVAFLSVAEFAELGQVNVSTVSRFAQALGLPGYPALRRLCKSHLRSQTMVDRFDAAPASDTELWESSGRFDQQNIARSFHRLEHDQVQRAARLLSDAPTVHVLGLRKSHSPAYLLWYLLQLVRDDVRLLHAANLVGQLREVRRGDAFVAITIHRYTRDTVLGCDYAHRQGAHTLAVTDNAGSPLLPIADEVFLADTSAAGVLRSMTAMVSLVQAIAATVAAHRGAASREALEAEESLLETFGVYHAPPGRRPGPPRTEDSPHRTDRS